MTTTQIISLIAAGIATCSAIWVTAREKRILPTISFSVGMLLFSAELVLGAAALSSDGASPLRWYQIRTAVLAVIPGVWLAFAVTFSRGNYAEFLKRWAPVIIALLTVLPGVLIFFPAVAMDPGTGALRFELGGRIVHIGMVLGSTAVLMNMERTFRAAVGVMRWQLKFAAIGIATLFVTRIYTSTQTLVFSAVDPTLSVYNAVALIVCCVLAGFSITRAKRFMLDLYPSTTLIHRSLTVMVVGAYLLCVGVLANAVSKLGTPSDFPLQALILLLAIVLLGTALLSDRARLASKRFVSRHLRRPVYDVRKVWREFNAHTAHHATEDSLCRASARWMSETFETLSVSLWLVRRDAESLALGASTCVDENDARRLLDQAEVGPALAALRVDGQPVNLDRDRNDAIGKLRILHPQRFPNGGDRICLPILSGNELVAVLMLGDRVAGISFSVEEMDLIKCIGDEIGGTLVRLRLAEKLGEAKEMQAFQTMATFFVHDLKNTAWTLSLLVENLRKHFDDPAFRAEAVKSLSTSVTRINDLVARIGSLREALRLNKAPADLNELVTVVSKEFAGSPSFTIEQDLQPVGRTSIDQEQIQSVVRNLLLNAKEAMTNGKGNVHISTRQSGPTAVITVRDNGCGMSDEFLRNKLFRPFQTTKNKGIGIGMFQSKTIVEAHDGRMLVDSKEGGGTTIRVMLPVDGDAK